jgi:UDP-glucose 6-dehydrogenase
MTKEDLDRVARLLKKKAAIVEEALKENIETNAFKGLKSQNQLDEAISATYYLIVFDVISLSF